MFLRFRVARGLGRSRRWTVAAAVFATRAAVVTPATTMITATSAAAMFTTLTTTVAAVTGWTVLGLVVSLFLGREFLVALFHGRAA